MVTVGPEAVTIEERSEGQRGVIRALLDEGPGTAAEIANREESQSARSKPGTG